MTITEGAFYPWTYDPDMTADLDALAKQHGVTLTASGVQDNILGEFHRGVDRRQPSDREHRI